MNSTVQHPSAPRPHRPRTRRSPLATAALLAAAAALTAGASACSAQSTPPAVQQPTAAAVPAGVESVSPQLAEARKAAATELKSVKGRGNAVGDIKLSAVDQATSHGHPAATVKITNHTAKAASYAIQVAFTDSSGKSVETTYTALSDLGPGQTATLLTFGTSTPQGSTTAKVAKAERH